MGSRRWLRWVSAWVVVLGCAAGAGERGQVGGPLAGVELPPFPTQHGEPPGHPGHSEGFPESELYPGSVEHFRTVSLKNLPIRPLWDRQSQVKNFLAHQLPGVARAQVEEYAAPVYQVKRYGPPVNTGKALRPVPVVRCKVGQPVLRLDLGELDAGLYAVRVIGAVETPRLRIFRQPLYLALKVNDGLDGSAHIYRLRIGYCDEFYSVAEFYFHATARRRFEAELWVDKGSTVDLLVHNISLDDMLAGTTHRAVKTRQTLVTPEQLALMREGLPEKERQAIEKLTACTPEERLARDAAIWDWLPPINSQGYGLLNAQAGAGFVPQGVADKTLEEINAEHGQWEVLPNIDHNLGMVLTRDPKSQNAFLINRKLGLSYTTDDLVTRRPLPGPYPYSDDGAGLFFPDPADPQRGRLLAPIAHGVQDRFRRGYHGMGGLRGYARTIHLSGNRELLRDAAVSLIRYAYQFPTIDSANYLAELAVAAGFQGLDFRCRQRHDKAYWMPDYAAYLAAIRDYDLLFPFIQGNEELAASIRRFVPWVQSSADLIRLLDVYLVQMTAKRTLRYLDHTHPTAIADLAAVLGDTRVTDPWMEWLFSRTFVYPLPPAGIQDVTISGHDREGAQYIASTFYARGEGASRMAAALDRYLAAGGNPRFDLSDPALYPKPRAHADWLLRILVAGCDRARIGDVSGPSLRQGDSLLDLDETVRAAWRWSGDPRFAWLLRHVYGRKGDSDADWARVEEAAAKPRRAPWLDNRSRAVENWFGVLETGQEHDDFRFRRAALVRTGAGIGHQHSDALDLQVFAHGMAMVMDGGARGGYSEPNDRITRVHNLVEVDGKDHLAYGWVQALSDAPGARYLRAAALPPPACSLFSRQTALVDVDEGQGSKPLQVEFQKPGARLPAGVVTPNSYVFDVFRVAGGKLHSYCCHATVNDDFQWNVRNPTPVEHLEKETGETDTEAQYLSPFSLSKGRKLAGDAPDMLQATWRQLRFEKDTKGGVSEESILGANFDPGSPPKFTRWHLFGTAGRRALQAQVVMHKSGYQWTALTVWNRSQGPPLDAAYPALVEPYVGEPFITAQRELPSEPNETDALRAVAVEVQTRNGRHDLCFADGRPDRTRSVQAAGGACRIAGEFAFVSRDAQGLRSAVLTGGTLLETPDLRIALAEREYSGQVTRVDYLNKTFWIDRPWPAACAGQVLKVQSPGCPTSYTIASVAPEGAGSRIVVTHGADFYRAPITQVLSGQRRVDGRLPLPAGRGSIRGMTASNDTLSTLWRIERNSGNDFTLEGGEVREADFAPSNALRIWEYGVGDRVRLAAWAAVRRTEPNRFELTGNASFSISLKAARLELSTDARTWVPAAGPVVEIGAAELSRGPVAIRVLP
ncbi:MAG TPA: hypothetical protein PLE19_11835 [Planctomycetota bacterium]|nr:hypothetical protein [Planctomycetota bacterium]